MDNQKKEFNRMKHEFEKWRDIILVLNSLLKWEKPYFPGIIFGIISTFFLVLWYMDLSFLTCCALCFLSVTLFDYLYPKFARLIFKPENWRGPEEKKFEEVTEEIFNLKMYTCSMYQFAITTKNEKSTLFILGASCLCVILAWVGSTFDNLFLAYITTLFVAFYPGAKKHGYFDILSGCIRNRLNMKCMGGIKDD